MVSSVTQNNHQGLFKIGFPRKQTQIDFNLQEIIKEYFGDQRCRWEGEEAALGRGRNQAVIEAKEQPQLTPMRGSVDWMTFHSCLLLQ